MSLGIDVSRYQGAIDFHAVKAAGIALVIAKQGGADSAGGVYTDRNYLTYRADARAAGLPFGSYFFNGPAASPVACADYFWAGMDYRPGDLAVIDVEGPGIAWSPTQALAFVQRMIAHGIPAASVGVYMSASPLRAQDWSAVAATGAFLWVASYGNNSGAQGAPPAVKWWSSWSSWQYTSNGSVPGIAGRVDMSQLAPGWPSSAVPPTRKKHAMPLNVVKKSTLKTTDPFAGQWATFGEPTCPVLQYARTATDDPGPAFGVAYGPHTPVSDGVYAWLLAQYSKAPPVGTVTVEPDPALLVAITAGNELLTELLAATKALNPPG